jgi:hypothetical protein
LPLKTIAAGRRQMLSSEPVLGLKEIANRPPPKGQGIDSSDENGDAEQAGAQHDWQG